MEYTKYTIVTFTNPKTHFDDKYSDNEVEFINDTFAKAALMTSQDKTPGYHEFAGAGCVKRIWKDQAAAEEWRDFIFATGEKYGVKLSSVEIFDATEEDNDI